MDIADDEDRALVERLRIGAASTARASQMLADAKSARNQAAEGGEWPGYEGLKPEQTNEWKAADAIERLHANLNTRDEFLGKAGLWDAFVAHLPR